MGWNISHGTNTYGEIRRSYGTVANLTDHLLDVAAPGDGTLLRPVFRRFDGSPFDISPTKAAAIAAALERCAAHPKMPAEWAQEATEFATAARTAATANEPWHWG